MANQFCIELRYDNEPRFFRSLTFKNICYGRELSGRGCKCCLATKNIFLFQSGGTKLRFFEGLTYTGTEGLNNVIFSVKRISYGLPKFEYLRLRFLTQAF